MGKDSVIQSVIGLIEPIIHGENLDLVDVEYKKEGKYWYLRVYIDKKGGVFIEDCQKVSRQIEDMIQIDEIINSAYILEVSSPGLDRPLKKEKDFIRSLGKKVKVTTYSPIDKQRNFVGVIKDISNQTLGLDVNGALVAIPLEIIANAKLVLEL
ncbi:MAG: ribosome maturation factor RimP [Nitrospinae bacterium RIFCSPLOWO2_12_FULL_47_7]|nr:MAG: ribosome maturation factor RimP [Nitrospinae bacterium RIFCSPLOWO2_12_FULL_47_7]